MLQVVIEEVECPRDMWKRCSSYLKELFLRQGECSKDMRLSGLELCSAPGGVVR